MLRITTLREVSTDGIMCVINIKGKASQPLPGSRRDRGGDDARGDAILAHQPARRKSRHGGFLLFDEEMMATMQFSPGTVVKNRSRLWRVDGCRWARVGDAYDTVSGAGDRWSHSHCF